MAVYTNDLRLKEIATGDESGTWGTSTNTNLSLIADAFGFGTEAISTNADTHTTTIADGSADPGRSIFLKYTGTLDSACTITIGPNTVSKLWLIENATSGSQNIIIKQGSGATVTIANGQTKAIYSDGAGSGGAMVDAFQDLSIPDLFIDDDLTFTSDSAVITFGADGDTTLTHTDGSGLTLNSTNKLMFNDASQFIQGSSATVLSLGATDEIDLTATAIDINGTIDVSGTSTLGGNTTILPSSDGDALIVGKSGGANLHIFANDSALLMTNASGAGSGRDGFQITNGNVLTEIDTVAKISVSASEVAINDASADTDFRVEGDSNANLLVVDASADKIGIGVAAPTELLHLQGDGADLLITDAGGGQTAKIGSTGSNNGIIELNNSSHTSTVVLNTSGDSYLNGGSVGIGLTSPGRLLTLFNNDQPVFQITNNTSGTASTRGLIQYVATGTSDAIFDNQGAGSGGPLLFQQAGTERFRLNTGEAVVNESSNDYDFRVESNGNTNAIFVDAGNDRVGILNDGTMGSNFNVLTQMSIGADNNNRGILDFSSGAFSIGTIQSGTATFSTFSVSSGAVFCNNSTSLGTSLILNNTSNGSGSTLKFLNDSSSPAGDDVLGSIDFNGNDSGGTQTTFARIRGSASNVTNGTEGGNMAFAIEDSGSFLEHMRINTAGVVVNEVSQAGTDFRVESNDNTHMLFVDSGANSIGINASDPTHPIDITANSSAHGVRIRGRSADDIGELNFQSNDGGTAHSQLQSLSTELKIRNIANIPMTFHTNNSERVRIDNAGLVGINWGASTARLGIIQSGSSTPGIAVTDGSTSDFIIYAGYVSGLARIGPSAGALAIQTANHERARFGTGGELFINATSAIGPGMVAVKSTSSTTGAFGCHNSNSGGSLMRFANAANNAVIGTISNNGDTAVAYNTTSDYRLKENINYTWEATNRLKQLKPAQFNFISDESNTTIDGFIAHEVSSVVPAAVTGEKDGVNEQGDPEYQGLDHSKLVPLLVKTIQELEARIAALESE